MRKKQNKGFTMVEVMVSIVVVSILMIPIIDGIVGAIKQSSTTKEVQQSNELAQHLMEYVKEDDIDSIMNLSYFDNVGSYDVTKTEKVKQDHYVDATGSDISMKYIDPKTGKEKTAFFDSYEIKGSMNVGTKNEKYSYLMEISSKDYALRQKNEAEGVVVVDPDAEVADTYLDPNNLSMGVVEDLDYKDVALINGTFANFDAKETNKFLTKKLSILQEKSPKLFEQYVNQTYDFNPFSRDKIKRNIIVSVGYDTTDPLNTKYLITCNVQYSDDSVYVLQDGTSMHQELVNRGEDVETESVYKGTFDTIPNIYLMYNVCLYNGFYSDRDYITIDTSALNLDVEKEVLDASKNKQTIMTTQPVNLFVVETASNYSDGAAEALAEVDVMKEEAKGAVYDESSRNTVIEAKKAEYAKRILYDNRNTATGDSRDDVHICFAASKNTTGAKLANVTIYHNFDYAIDDDVDDDNYGSNYVAGQSKSNKKNRNLHYVDNLTVDSNYGSFPYVYTKNALNKNEGSLCGYVYNSVNGVRDGTKSARVKSIDKAKQQSRGLYTVKLWMVKGDIDDIDKSVDPLISGSKGGNAIEK